MYMAPLGFRGVLGQPTGDLAHPCVDNDLRLPGLSHPLGAAEIENGDVHLPLFPPLFSRY
jgi:hypothetical protein